MYQSEFILLGDFAAKLDRKKREVTESLKIEITAGPKALIKFTFLGPIN